MTNETVFTHSISHPIHRARPREDNSFLITGEIVGTCFSLGGSFMITAGHVIDELDVHGLIGVVGLIEPKTRATKGARIISKEKLPCDIGLLQVDFLYPPSASWAHTLAWRNDTLGQLEHIKCLGYPYGMHSLENEISLIQRAFQGYIIAAIDRFVPRGLPGNPFPVYELSFPAPRGLSGAPILTSTGSFQIAGIVIGNSKSSMLVFESEEVDSETSTKRVVQHYESLSLGIAVQAQAILRLNSMLLGSTISNFIKSRQPGT